MKAQELRIGNYAYDDEGALVVLKSIADLSERWPDEEESTKAMFDKVVNGKRAGYYECDITELTPVNLTEEWLLKAGFQKHTNLILPSYHMDIAWHPNEYKSLYVTIEKGNQYLGVRDGNKSKPREQDDIVIIRNSDRHGEIFVHHVQNAYSLLTGTELEFAD